MNWLTEGFADKSIAWLLITTVIAALSGLISSYFTYRFIRYKELKDTKVIESESAKKERIRQEVIRWANPILGAVQDLDARLINILEIEGYLALSKDYQENMNPNWSISYDYFMNSTLYLFAQYFCWIRMLQEKLNFELFQTQKEKDDFFDAILNVSRALCNFPPNYGRGDKQVFMLQQRAIGEQMIDPDNDEVRCLSYPEFIKKLDSDRDFQKHMEPLRQLLQDLSPDNEGRWERLKNTQIQLTKLSKVCSDLLFHKS